MRSNEFEFRTEEEEVTVTNNLQHGIFKNMTQLTRFIRYKEIKNGHR